MGNGWQWPASIVLIYVDLISVPQELVASIKKYLSEVNKSLGLDRAKKQEFAANLAKHPWFPHTGYEVPEMLAEMGSVCWLPGSSWMFVFPRPVEIRSSDRHKRRDQSAHHGILVMDLVWMCCFGLFGSFIDYIDWCALTHPLSPQIDIFWLDWSRIVPTSPRPHLTTNGLNSPQIHTNSSEKIGTTKIKAIYGIRQKPGNIWELLLAQELMKKLGIFGILYNI